MRKTTMVLAVNLAVAAALVTAAGLEISSDLMQNIEEATKSLDSSVALKDGKAAVTESRELQALFAQVEAFYKLHPEAGQGLALSQKARGLADEVARHVASNDFSAAAGAVDDLARSCKQCHEVYKK